MNTLLQEGRNTCVDIISFNWTGANMVNDLQQKFVGSSYSQCFLEAVIFIKDGTFLEVCQHFLQDRAADLDEQGKHMI